MRMASWKGVVGPALAWTAALALAAVVSTAAQQGRRGPGPSAPRFAGKLPEPPMQGRPWTPPKTLLPKFLTTATGLLFEQGVADPRSCEYREVGFGGAENGGGDAKYRGFVLPERADVPGRFAVGWDGLVHPVASVGEPADLDAEVKALADQMRAQRRKLGAEPRHYGRDVSWAPEASGLVLGRAGPLRLVLLLRLGRADLAEALFAAATPWTPEPRARDLTDYGVSYLTLATDWATSCFLRLVGAHQQGDDATALDLARNLAKFRDLATAQADALGFPRPEGPNRGGGIGGGGARPPQPAPPPAPRFPFLGQLDDLLRDQERRAQAPPRGANPPKGGDPTARIAALIRDLDQIAEYQMSSLGGANPGASRLVRDLIAEGDPAVGPLLAVLESDDRLTRSVSTGRGMLSIERYVHPVHEAAFAGLIGILKTREFDSRRSYGWTQADPAARKALAGDIRRFWEKTRGVALTERWFRTLLDDSAGTGRWLEAAGAIVQPVAGPSGLPPAPGPRPMQGEPLRDRVDPTVAELMARRAREIERSNIPETYPDVGFEQACTTASFLVAWDEKAALPLVQHLGRGAVARWDRWGADTSREHDRQRVAATIGRFTQVRARLGDAAALDEYAAWLRTTGPEIVDDGRSMDALKPLLDRPDHPTLAATARWLFTDPKSPWTPLLPEARGGRTQPFRNILASPLVVTSGFREGLIAGLADKAPLGSVSRAENRNVAVKIRGRAAGGYGSSHQDVEGFEVGVEYPFRACDYLASRLAELEGAPRCELFWPEPRRDEAVAACLAYLKKYGDRFTADAPPGVNDFPDPKAHLEFPSLGRPATRADVAAGLAIFSLEGEGEVRLAELPGFPQQARWLTRTDAPVYRQGPDGVDRREYDTAGFVWQAEEVRKGDVWERSYGFVGHHVVGRAPAAEVEFGEPYGPWGRLKGGLDARVELVAPRSYEVGYRPGEPIPAALHLRDRLGVPRQGPTELVRPGADGKPALRKGLALTLWRTDPDAEARRGVGQGRSSPEVAVETKRDARFDPDGGARTLQPLESFEAGRLDLGDWFDLAKPGLYRVGLTFAAESDAGEGAAGAAYFRVSE